MTSIRCVAAAALLALSATSTSAQTADEIIEKHLAASGGRESLARIRSRVATGSITVTTPIGPLAGTVESFAKVPNKSRTLVKLDLSALGAGQVINDQRFDGTSAYVIDSINGNREITGAQLDALRNLAFPTAWLDYVARGLSVALIGKESLGDRPAYLLETTPKAGPRVRTWVDAETYMLLKTATSVVVPELGGEIEQVTEFSDFRTVDGVKTPFGVKSINPAQTVTAVITDVKHNVDVDDASFAKPAEQ
jgi:outer membrane lipoprotein-sorting protein